MTTVQSALPPSAASKANKKSTQAILELDLLPRVDLKVAAAAPNPALVVASSLLTEALNDEALESTQIK